MTRPGPMKKRGNVMVLTLAVVLALAGMSLVFTGAMRVEAIAAANVEAQAQARAIVDGAALAVVALQDEMPADAVRIGEGGFWLLRPELDEERQDDWAWGVIDEAGKLNLNHAPLEMLERLPGVTTEMAAAIIDWRDANTEPTDGGAESDFYLMLADPYRAKDAPFQSVEELLLVRDFTPGVLYGEDANRNGVLDANENDGDRSPPADNADGRLDPGLVDLVRVYQREGGSEEPVNVNNPGGGGQSQRLEEVLAASLPADRAAELAAAIAAQRPFNNLIDMFYKTRMTVEEFAQIASRLTAGQEGESPININTAPRLVLLTLPDLTESDVEALIAYRTSRESADAPEAGEGAAAMDPLAGIAWITQVLDQEKAVAVGGWITTQGGPWTADIVAVGRRGRGFERYRVTFDDASDTPRRLAWQRLTHLGWPLDPQILADLRAGRVIEDLAQSVDRGDF